MGTASFSMGIFSPGVPLLQGVELKEKTSCCMAFILAGSFIAKRAQVVALLTYCKIVKRCTHMRENTVHWKARKIKTSHETSRMSQTVLL